MGNTIRREPVSFKIPDSPDYKFLNITNFQGIHQTDNPFLADSNTASDCLNVYVDETNTLTTRPRLEKKFSLPREYETLHIYPVSDGFIYQVNDKYSGNVEFVHVHNDGGYSPLKNDSTFKFSSKKVCVLEHEKRYYILDGTKFFVCKLSDNDFYYHISDGYSDEDTYIPNVSIGSVSSSGLGAEVDDEDYNMLSGYCTKTYLWDGLSDSSPALLNSIKFENKDVSVINVDKELKGTTFSIGNQRYVTYSSDRIYIWTIIDDTIEIENSINDSSIKCVSVDGKYYGKISDDEKTLSIYDMSKKHIRTVTIPADGSDESSYIDEAIILKDELGVILTVYTYSSVLMESKISALFYEKDATGIYSREPYEMYKLEKWVSGDARIKVFTDSSSTAALIIREFGEFDGTLISNLLGAEKNKQTVGIPALRAAIEGSLLITSPSLSSFGVSTRGRVTISNIKKESDETRIFYDAIDTARSFAFVNNDNTVLYCDTSGLKGYDVVKKTQYKLSAYHNDKQMVMLSDGTVLYINSDNNKIDNVLIHTASGKPNLVVTYKNKNVLTYQLFDYIKFKNQWWFYGEDSFLCWSSKNNPTYLPYGNRKTLGKTEEPIMDAVLLNSYNMALIKKDKWFLVSTDETSGEDIFYENKNTNGAVTKAAIVSSYGGLPLFVGEDAIFGFVSMENTAQTDNTTVSISDKIKSLFLNIKDKKNIFSTTKDYWVYFFVPHETTTECLLLDERTGSWYLWNFNKKIICAHYDKENLMVFGDTGVCYVLTNNDIITNQSTEYYDDGKEIIQWFWRSQILPLGTINYSKKLNSTTFIMTDTDESDEYGLNYKFKVFRKLATESNATTISNRLNYIQSVTKKTIIPRFNFLQFEISNVEEDYDNNKLRLVGLSLKYELLAGLM